MSWHLAGLTKDKPAFMWSHPTMVRFPIGYTEAMIRQMCMLVNGAVPAQSVPGRDVMARYMADLASREQYIEAAVRCAGAGCWCRKDGDVVRPEGAAGTLYQGHLRRLPDHAGAASAGGVGDPIAIWNAATWRA